MMLSLIHKELRDFSVNHFGIVAIGLLVLLVYLFLWIFPDTNYLSYGLAETDLFFEIMSYLLLFVVPAFAVSLLTIEFKSGTEELIRSFHVNWRNIIFAKFTAAMIILVGVFILCSPNIFVLEALGGEALSLKTSGSYLGLLGIGACYASLSLMVASFVMLPTASYLIAVVFCFMLHSGISMLGSLPVFEGGIDVVIDQMSISYHANQIGLGILRLSSIFYFVGVTMYMLWLAAHRLNTKEI